MILKSFRTGILLAFAVVSPTFCQDKRQEPPEVAPPATIAKVVKGKDVSGCRKDSAGNAIVWESNGHGYPKSNCQAGKLCCEQTLMASRGNLITIPPTPPYPSEVKVVKGKDTSGCKTDSAGNPIVWESNGVGSDRRPPTNCPAGKMCCDVAQIVSRGELITITF